MAKKKTDRDTKCAKCGNDPAASGKPNRAEIATRRAAPDDEAKTGTRLAVKGAKRHVYCPVCRTTIK